MLLSGQALGVFRVLHRKGGVHQQANSVQGTVRQIAAAVNVMCSAALASSALVYVLKYFRFVADTHIHLSPMESFHGGGEMFCPRSCVHGRLSLIRMGGRDDEIGMNTYPIFNPRRRMVGRRHSVNNLT